MKATGVLLVGILALCTQLQPAATAAVIIVKAGVCPEPAAEEANCTMGCQSDGDCESTLKCCPAACGKACQEPNARLALSSVAEIAARDREHAPAALHILQGASAAHCVSPSTVLHPALSSRRVPQQCPLQLCTKHSPTAALLQGAQHAQLQELQHGPAHCAGDSRSHAASFALQRNLAPAHP
ncbi:WAP four-disulfide core domain protein 2-like [Numida meleagris]|uniref:WAP four-disulfide core domain protein 2-like n=1 Tax=Numida meleagris TaxID=8996 RepID=UPI000B3E00A1|nr:WAP four-disulfide core domain protein 2-like [Numida meleagris]